MRAMLQRPAACHRATQQLRPCLPQHGPRLRPAWQAAAASAAVRPRRRSSCVTSAAAAAAADMGGPHDGARLQLGWGAPALRQRAKQLLQPSPYDAELFQLAVPALAAMMVEPLLNIISAAVLGHLGTQQLGAVSLASLATSLATYIFSFLVFLTTPRVAAAHANGDAHAVSRLAAVGLWLAAGTGTLVAIGMNAGAALIVAALKPREPEVAAYAVEYIRVRSWGILAAMLGFVASGTYRGVKDTATPLKGALGAAATHLALTPALILGLGWGVWGAGLATTLSQWVQTSILLSLMLRRRLLRPSDLAQPPRQQEVVPYLWKGAVLAFRMVVTFGMVMFSSALCVRAGAASQAAFEIVRQVWVISIQLFESLNVATQAMAAGFLGRHDVGAARAVLTRALLLATCVGVGVGAVLLAARGPLVSAFTADPLVASLAGGILPVIIACMPLDAAASILDGGLIAAGQTNALSVIQVAGSLVQYGLLAWLVATGSGSVFNVWAVLKVLTAARLLGGAWVHFGSRRSAYKPAAGAAAAAVPAAAAVVAADALQQPAEQHRQLEQPLEHQQQHQHEQHLEEQQPHHQQQLHHHQHEQHQHQHQHEQQQQPALLLQAQSPSQLAHKQD